MQETLAPPGAAPSARGLVPILALTMCAFAIGTAEFVIAGLLPDIARDLNVSIPAAGQLVTAYALGVVVGAKHQESAWVVRQFEISVTG